MGGSYLAGTDLMHITSAHLPLARAQFCGRTSVQERQRDIVVGPEEKEMNSGKYTHRFAITSKWKT